MPWTFKSHFIWYLIILLFQRVCIAHRRLLDGARNNTFRVDSHTHDLRTRRICVYHNSMAIIVHVIGAVLRQFRTIRLLVSPITYIRILLNPAALFIPGSTFNFSIFKTQSWPNYNHFFICNYNFWLPTSLSGLNLQTIWLEKNFISMKFSFFCPFRPSFLFFSIACSHCYTFSA